VDDGPDAHALIQDRRTAKDVKACSIFDVWARRKPVLSAFEPYQADDGVIYYNYMRAWFEKLDSRLP
jgi:hypothetical protein